MAFIVAVGSLHHSEFTPFGVKVNQNATYSNFESTRGLTVAEVMMKLATRAGRQQVNDVVYQAWTKALDAGSTLQEILDEAKAATARFYVGEVG